MNKEYFVYIHTCPNNKIYIGITCNPKLRWGKNGCGYRNNLLFYKAIKKYGWENIKHEIIYSSLTLKRAQEIEIELIKKYDSTNTEKGYNISIGGDKTTTGYKFTNKQREKLSISKTTPVYCVEDDKIYYSYKELKSLGYGGYKRVVNGERNTCKGKHFLSIEDMYKLKNNKLKLKNSSLKKVICLETKKIYNSISEAARCTNSNAASISSCCENKLKSTNKLHWQYYDENFVVGKCDDIINEKKILNDKRIKKVICIDTGEIYDSASSANKKTNILHISDCCKGLRKSAGGFLWRYDNEL